MEFSEEVVAQPPQDVEIEKAMCTFSLCDDEEDNSQTMAKVKAANNDPLEFKIEEISLDSLDDSKELINRRSPNSIEIERHENKIVQNVDNQVPSDDEFGMFQDSTRKLFVLSIVSL